MIDDRFRDNEGMGRIGQKAVHNTFQGSQLRGELRCSLGIPIKPFFQKIDLIGEVEGGGAESG